MFLQRTSFLSEHFSVWLQGVIHWVAEPTPGVEPVKVEIRQFDRLFKSEVGLANLVVIVGREIDLVCLVYLSV